MPRVTRAIIMAAGIGKRMQPLTLTTPKPLISVNNTRMIDSAINGLHKNGIFEIYIVVGYLKEQFYQLERQFPGVKIIENPYYETCNNISSLYVARDYIEEAMIHDQIEQDVRNLIDHLPVEQREVVVLRHYFDLSFKEIAQQTGVSINTALGRMRYALINLRKLIDEKQMAFA